MPWYWPFRAHIAADLVASIDVDAGTLLAEWQHASVALATIAYDRADLEVDPAQSGFLVGRSEGLLMTACSFAGSKWAHLDHPERTVLRVSCGRIGRYAAQRVFPTRPARSPPG
ncbi:MAG: hypothetical protein CM1200mP26_03890 [Acidimicrobiales bacterium]|nr:MAG: hypothetical protein CM1200mP26_03890 [Acidimicrobiales bacterium]